MAAGAKYGIYLDDNTSGQEVYGNIFYNVKGCAVVLHGGRENRVHDNIFINSTISYTEPCFSDEEFFSSAFYTNLIDQRADESSPAYGTWLKRWTILYNYSYDIADIGKYECVFTTVHHIKNNCFIGGGNKVLDFGDTADEYGDLENNVKFNSDTNPLFTDPTHGDYTLKSGADVMGDEYLSNVGHYGIKK